MLMEMELDLVLNRTSFNIFVKMIGIEDFKIQKTSLETKPMVALKKKRFRIRIESSF
jgi:hypothetical protein